MIIVKLQGGLGNQMFQYAFGISLSKEKNIPVLFDKSWYDRNHSRDLNIRGIVKKIGFASKYQIAKTLYPKNKLMFFLSLISHVVWKYSPFFLTEKKYFEFDSNLYKIIPKSCYLDGYWINKNYFINNKNEIENIFIGNDLENNLNYKNIIESNSTSIHIRLGDYVNLSSVSTVCDKEYYINAIKYLTEKYEDLKFFIFSDDVDKAKEILPTDHNFNFIKENKFFPEQDLFLMSACRNNIIANSTFSWWSAYLNKNKNKIVIAPKIWNTVNKEVDVIPNTWLKI